MANDALAVISDLDQIPPFSTEAEEAEFWDTHTFSDELWDELPGLTPNELALLPTARTTIELRLPRDVAARLLAISGRRHVSARTLASQFVTERLYEEEKREGLIGR